MCKKRLDRFFLQIRGRDLKRIVAALFVLIVDIDRPVLQHQFQGAYRPCRANASKTTRGRRGVVKQEAKHRVIKPLGSKYFIKNSLWITAVIDVLKQELKQIKTSPFGCLSKH